MLLLRQAYRGHYIELRSDDTVDRAGRWVRPWVDGEALPGEFPGGNSSRLEASLQAARGHVDALRSGQALIAVLKSGSGSLQSADSALTRR